MQAFYKGREVYLVDGSRSAFLKAKGKPGEFSAADLAVMAARPLFNRLPIEPTDIDESVFGCMMPSPDETNIGRLIAYRLGCGKKVPGYTVQRNCASGLQAIDDALKDIAMGRCNLVLAGGTDAMSHAPLLYNQQAVNWFAGMFAAKSLSAKLKQLLALRPAWFFKPIVSLVRGLTDPMCCLIMGKTAENIAYQFSISRQAMDEFAVQSHQRLAQAIDDDVFQQELVTLISRSGKVFEQDDGLRRDSALEKLAKLKPFFDKKYGKVTAANSAQVTDGAACVILASAEAVKQYDLPVLAKIVDIHWAALDPALMGLGPVYATTPLLQRNQLTKNDIDYWEINEAFAGQVIGCLKAWQDVDFCQQELGLNEALGDIDQAKLNIDGGAIAIGHPVGASGTRISLHLANVLRRKQAKLGIASLCIGGGLGGAMLLQRVDRSEIT